MLPQPTIISMITFLGRPNFESKIFLISYVISVCYIIWSLDMGSNQSHQKMCLPITVEHQCEEACLLSLGWFEPWTASKFKWIHISSILVRMPGSLRQQTTLVRQNKIIELHVYVKHLNLSRESFLFSATWQIGL